MIEIFETGTLEMQKSSVINVPEVERMHEIQLRVITGDAFKIPGVSICAFSVHSRSMLIPGVNRTESSKMLLYANESKVI